MSFEIIFLWRGYHPMFRNMWWNYRQIQFSWLWFFVIVEKKWMTEEERIAVRIAREKKAKGELMIYDLVQL